MPFVPTRVDAVILAGGVNRVSLYEGYRPGYKAIVDLRGRPSVRYVLEALRASRYIRDIAVVGVEELLAPVVRDGVAFVPPDDNPLGSFLAGMRRFQDRDLVLMVTADLPLLRGDLIDAFIDAAAGTPTPYRENAYIAVIHQKHFRGVFARSQKPMNHFRDGIYAHGNMLLAQPGFLRNGTAMERFNAMYAARKSELRSALALGLGVGLAYVIGVHFLHALTPGQLARIASRRFQMGIVTVPFPHPEVAQDVDNPEDYQLVQEILSGPPPGPVPSSV